MIIIYTPNHRQHDPTYELYDGVKTVYAESADRADAIAASLATAGFTAPRLPHHFADKHLLALHRQPYVSYLRRRSAELPVDVPLYPSYHISDTYAPVTHGTYPAARDAVDVALTGAQQLQRGERLVYALCRPPGHHAEAATMGGYCYLNNCAIAAHYLSVRGRVSILDIDFHHGNGTQHMFYNRSDVQYVSLHGDPARTYPYISGFGDETGRGEGAGYNWNFPLPAGTDDRAYAGILAMALGRIQDFKPEYLLVSAGFDTHEHDPICDFKLTTPFYRTIGQQVAALGLPLLVVQEGGYDVSVLGDNVVSFLRGCMAP